MQGRALGNEIGFFQRLAQRFAPQPAPFDNATGVAQVQHTLDVVAVRAPHRQQGVVALLNTLDDDLVLVVEVDAVEIAARHHNVIDGDALKIEDTHQHAAVTLWNHGARIGDDAAQFLARYAVPAAL